MKLKSKDKFLKVKIYTGKRKVGR